MTSLSVVIGSTNDCIMTTEVVKQWVPDVLRLAIYMGNLIIRLSFRNNYANLLCERGAGPLTRHYKVYFGKYLF